MKRFQVFAVLVFLAVSSIASFAGEITFTFDSPDYPWTNDELATLENWVSVYYPLMKQVYGPPAFDITINVQKDPFFSDSGGYGRNTIWLQNLHNDTFIHELAHAFHDDYMIPWGMFEEGMARAAEVAVLNVVQDESYWDLFHRYDKDVYYEQINLGGLIGFDYGLPNYQLAGYVWSKMYLEDNEFLRKFNQEYYARRAQGGFEANPDSLKEIVKKIKPSVEDVDLERWYSKQNVMRTDPATGYHMMLTGDTKTIYVFYRDLWGTETMLSGINVQWDIYDHQGNLLLTGNDTTSQNGWIQLPQFLGYEGRIKIIAKAAISGEEITRTFDSITLLSSNFPGIFGILLNGSEGNVVITHLSDGITETVSVINGAFYAPSMEQLSGKFLAEYQREDGTWVGKVFTKDSSDYLVMFDDSAGTSSRAICSYLGDNRSGRSDTDTFSFAAMGGEKVTIELLNQDESIAGNVMIRISGNHGYRSKKIIGTPPLTISDELLREGKYTVDVIEKMGQFNYCLTLNSSSRAYKHYKSTANVESVKP